MVMRAWVFPAPTSGSKPLLRMCSRTQLPSSRNSGLEHALTTLLNVTSFGFKPSRWIHQNSFKASLPCWCWAYPEIIAVHGTTSHLGIPSSTWHVSARLPHLKNILISAFPMSQVPAWWCVFGQTCPTPAQLGWWMHWEHWQRRCDLGSHPLVAFFGIILQNTHCPCWTQPAIMEFQDTKPHVNILLSTWSASATLPNLAYMLVRAFSKWTFDSTPLLATWAWSFLPSSRSMGLIHAPRTQLRVTLSGSMLCILSNSSSILSQCPSWEYHAMIVFHETTSRFCILLNTCAALDKLPHLPYILTSAFPTGICDSSWLLTIRVWMISPGSLVSGLSQAERMLKYVIVFDYPSLLDLDLKCIFNMPLLSISCNHCIPCNHIAGMHQRLAVHSTHSHTWHTCLSEQSQQKYRIQIPHRKWRFHVSKLQDCPTH